MTNLLATINNNDNDGSFHHAQYMALAMTCLTVYYDKVEDIVKGPFEEMLDPRFADRKTKVPYFVRFKQPFVPYKIEGENLENLYRYLMVLKVVLSIYNQQEYTYDMDNFILQAIVDDQKDGEIEIELETIAHPRLLDKYYEFE